MTHYKIEMNAIGRGTFEIDGQDVSASVQGFSINVRPNTATEIYLQLVPGDIKLEGDGIVYILDGNSLENFLEGLDPEIIKAKALGNMGWDSDGEEDVVIAAVNYIKQLGSEFNGD